MARMAYVTYEDAQRLKDIFAPFVKGHPNKLVRESAGRILQELKSVRDIDTDPLPGYQLILEDKDYEVLRTALER